MLYSLCLCHLHEYVLVNLASLLCFAGLLCKQMGVDFVDFFVSNLECMVIIRLKTQSH